MAVILYIYIFLIIRALHLKLLEAYTLAESNALYPIQPF